MVPGKNPWSGILDRQQGLMVKSVTVQLIKPHNTMLLLTLVNRWQEKCKIKLTIPAVICLATERRSLGEKRSVS